MNEDNIKPILEELGITPTDSWQTIHKMRNQELICYYYTFNYLEKTYCVSGDSISYCFSSEDNPFDMLYVGFSLYDLKKAIEKILQN